jgi:hypothetical protein
MLIVRYRHDNAVSQSRTEPCNLIYKERSAAL